MRVADCPLLWARARACVWLTGLWRWRGWQDIEFVERRLEELQKVMKRSNEKVLKQELETQEKLLDWLKDGKDVRAGDWKALDVEFINTMQLLSAKPVVYLVSVTKAAPSLDFNTPQSQRLVG